MDNQKNICKSAEALLREFAKSADEGASELLQSVVQGVAGQYYALYHINIKKNQYICFQDSLDGVLSVIGSQGDAEKSRHIYAEQFVEEEDREAFLDYCDLQKMPERMQMQNSLCLRYRRKNVGWLEGHIIVVKRDENDNPLEIIYILRDINKEVKKEEEREAITYMSQHDFLTGLWNREGLQAVLESGKYSQGRVGTLLLDIDHLKEVNDSEGHSVGDDILEAMGKTLRAMVREEDDAFRLGGDEFMLLFRGNANMEKKDAYRYLERKHLELHEELKRLFPNLSLTVSIGCCLSEDGYQKTHYRLADGALYTSKIRGRAAITFVDATGNILEYHRDESTMLSRSEVWLQHGIGTFQVDYYFRDGSAHHFLLDNDLRRIFGMPENLNGKEAYRFWKDRITPASKEVVERLQTSLIEGRRSEADVWWIHPKKGTVKLRLGAMIHESFEDHRRVIGYCHEMTAVDMFSGLDISKSIKQAMEGMYFCNFYINLDTKDTILYKKGEELALLSEDGVYDIREIFDHMNLVPFAEDSGKEMRAFLETGTLGERLKNTGMVSCDFCRQDGKGWKRAVFFVVDRKEDGMPKHVCYVEESIEENKQRERELIQARIETMRLENKASGLLRNTKVMMVLKVESDTGRVFLQTKDTTQICETQYIYDEVVKSLLPDVMAEEREIFAEKMSLAYVCKRLRKEDVYRMTANIENKEYGYGLFNFHFTKFDENGKYLVLVVEDVATRDLADELTRELNDDGFVHYAKYCLKNKNEIRRLAVLNFNIQDFASMNSMYGYQIGDEILKKVASHLKNADFAPLAICRENADSFFCLVNKELLDYEKLEQLCHLERRIETLQLSIRLRCGVYLVENRDESIQRMCDHARRACLRVKNSSVSGAYCFYDRRRDQSYLDDVTVVQEFPRALINQEFQVFFQPTYDVMTKKITSAEALIRWISQDGTPVSPGLFIPALEKSGDIAQLDMFVRHEVQKLLQERHRAGKKNVRIGTNLSRVDFYNEHAMKDLVWMYETSPVYKKYGVIEITESALMDIPEDGKTLLKDLQSQGALLAMDDFGTGASSLVSLTEVQFDTLKLDIQFIKNIGKSRLAEEIIKACIQSATRLGLSVVAEGVETEEQYQFLKENGCPKIQGFYFARPMPREEFEKLLDEEI